MPSRCHSTIARRPADVTPPVVQSPRTARSMGPRYLGDLLGLFLFEPGCVTGASAAGPASRVSQAVQRSRPCREPDPTLGSDDPKNCDHARGARHKRIKATVEHAVPAALNRFRPTRAVVLHVTRSSVPAGMRQLFEPGRCSRRGTKTSRQTETLRGDSDAAARSRAV